MNRLTGYAGARSAVTGERHSLALAGAPVDKRLEADLSARKTTSAARALVANMVAERLAQQPSPAALPVPTTPRTPRSAHSATPAVSTPSADPRAVQTPASQPNSYASSRRSTQHFQANNPQPTIARAASQQTPAPGGGAAASTTTALQQPVWRPPGSTATRAAGGAAGDSKASGDSKPRSWLTRDELVEQVEAANRRAELAEAAAEGGRLAMEELRLELEAAETRAAEAAAAAAAAKSHALTVGDNEMRLRGVLDDQASQLATAVGEEAAAREAARKALVSMSELDAKLEASEAHAAKNGQRAEKAERLLREAREGLAAARATQAEVDTLRRELVEAKEAAAAFRTQAADEASAKRTLGVQARETRAALHKLREETAAQNKEADAAAARDATLYTERLGALRHVNGVLEGRLRSLFDKRLKDSSKATTLQEAVQMLTDEYVVVVDQLRVAQANAGAEQGKVNELESAHAELSAELRVAIEKRREAEARLEAALSEIGEVDEQLVPRLTQDAVVAAHMQISLAEAQRQDAQNAATAARRVHVAEGALARVQESAASQEEEVVLLKRRLNQSLKRIRELQAIVDEGSNRRWQPPASVPERLGTRGVTRSAPASPSVQQYATNRGSSRTPSQRVAVRDDAFAEDEAYYEDSLMLAASGTPPGPNDAIAPSGREMAPSPRNRAPIAFVS